jgi:hypothetical protein
MEVVLSYDATGHPSSHTGFYGYDGFWYPPGVDAPIRDNCPGPSGCYEPDNPDALAFNQMIAIHTAGTIFQNNNNPNPLPHLPQTIESGNKWGLLSTPSAATWYYNDATNGSPGVGAFNTFGNATDLYNSKQCLGFVSNAAFPTTYTSIKVWQTSPPPGPATGGGIWKMLHRR